MDMIRTVLFHLLAPGTLMMSEEIDALMAVGVLTVLMRVLHHEHLLFFDQEEGPSRAEQHEHVGIMIDEFVARTYDFKKSVLHGRSLVALHDFSSPYVEELNTIYRNVYQSKNRDEAWNAVSLQLNNWWRSVLNTPSYELVWAIVQACVFLYDYKTVLSERDSDYQKSILFWQDAYDLCGIALQHFVSKHRRPLSDDAYNDILQLKREQLLGIPQRLRTGSDQEVIQEIQNLVSRTFRHDDPRRRDLQPESHGVHEVLVG